MSSTQTWDHYQNGDLTKTVTENISLINNLEIILIFIYNERFYYKITEHFYTTSYLRKKAIRENILFEG